MPKEHPHLITTPNARYFLIPPNHTRCMQIAEHAYRTLLNCPPEHLPKLNGCTFVMVEGQSQQAWNICHDLDSPDFAPQ